MERRGRGHTRHLRKPRKEIEEDLFAELQRLRAENEYLKNLQALVLERERRQGKKPGSPKTKAEISVIPSACNRSTAPGYLLLPPKADAKGR